LPDPPAPEEIGRNPRADPLNLASGGKLSHYYKYIITIYGILYYYLRMALQGPMECKDKVYLAENMCSKVHIYAEI
jgi:hypothetical protein